MLELVQANWPLFVAALLIGIAVAWLVFVATRKTKVEVDRRDVLDEDAGPAARNQALIDSEPASKSAVAAPAVPPVTPPGLAGAGAAVAVASEPAPTPAPAEPATAEGDDLTRMKGVGPKLATTLRELGITRFEQIAAWTDTDIDRIDAQLGRFQGRIRRDGWVEQARLLAAGDTSAFEAKYGKM